MLKNKFWIVALFAALTMAFVGCTNLAEGLDDGSGPLPAEDLVIEGDDIVLKSCGSNFADVKIDGNKVTFSPAGGNNGFYYEFNDTELKYPNVIFYFKVISVDGVYPGFLIKNTDMSNYTGITGDKDPKYQMNYEVYSFEEGMEFNTGPKKTNAFKNGRIAFFHQAYSPDGNTGGAWSVEVQKIVFPGSGAEVEEAIRYIPPEIPEGDSGYFYLNLNDLGTQGAEGVAPNDRVPAYVALDKVTLKFSKNNQRVHFKLTPEQNAVLTEASANGTVTITLVGKATYTGTIDASVNTGQLFRFGMADPAATSGWNGTNLTGASPVSGVAYTGTVTGFNNDNKKAATLSYLTIQARQDFPISLEVESVKIAYTIPVLPGNLVIDEDEITTPAAGIKLTAIYTGEQVVSYEWKRDNTVVGTQASIFASSAVTAGYTVTASAYGWTSKSAVFDKYDVTVNIPLSFSDTGDGATVTGGKLVVKAELPDPVGDDATAGYSVTNLPDGTGYTIANGTGGGWGNVYAVFSIDFPVASSFVTPNTVAGAVKYIKEVTFDITGVAGDTRYKTAILQISDEEITGYQSNNGTPITVGTIQTGETSLDNDTTPNTNDAAPHSRAITVDKGKTVGLPATGTIYFALWIAGPSGSSWTISNVVLK